MATESADVLKQARRSRRIPAILPYLFYRFYRHADVLKQARRSRRFSVRNSPLTVGTLRDPRPQVSRLLGIEGTELSTALCTRRLVTRDDEITVPLNLEQARSREIAI